MKYAKIIGEREKAAAVNYSGGVKLVRRRGRVLGRSTQPEKRRGRYTRSMDIASLMVSNGPWTDVTLAAASSRGLT